MASEVVVFIFQANKKRNNETQNSAQNSAQNSIHITLKPFC